MSQYLKMQAPSSWNIPTVPASMMPSGQAYRLDSLNQIDANPLDVGILLGLDFNKTGGNAVAAIQPETGASPIKISAFPNAPAVMGPSDIVTGLQGGANVNFTRAQIFTGRPGTGTGTGETLFLYGGAAVTTGRAGSFYAYGGNSVDGFAGSSGVYGGLATGNGHGGSANVDAGSAEGTGTGGDCIIQSGGSSGGVAGNIQLIPNLGVGGVWGFLYISHLSTADPHKVNAVWNNSGVLTLSAG